MLSVFTPYFLPLHLSVSVLCLFNSDGWMTNTFTLDPQPRSLSTLYACVSNYILESSTWMPQRHLKCSVARAGVLPSSGAPALLHASPLSVNDALTILLHKPQIYGASLMLSSPSPNVQSITQFTWFLSTECLFNPSTSVHVPWLPLDPAFFFFFLVSHPDCGGSLLPSLWL